MAHLEKIPLERATLVDRWRLKCSWVLHFFRWNLYYLDPFTVKYAGKIIARPISRRKHIWIILNILLDGITHLKKGAGDSILVFTGLNCGIIWCSQCRRCSQPIGTFLLKTNSVTGGQACIIIHPCTICSTQQNIHPKMYQHLLCLLKIKLTKG